MVQSAKYNVVKWLIVRYIGYTCLALGESFLNFDLVL